MLSHAARDAICFCSCGNDLRWHVGVLLHFSSFTLAVQLRSSFLAAAGFRDLQSCFLLFSARITTESDRPLSTNNIRLSCASSIRLPRHLLKGCLECSYWSTDIVSISWKDQSKVIGAPLRQNGLSPMVWSYSLMETVAKEIRLLSVFDPSVLNTVACWVQEDGMIENIIVDGREMKNMSSFWWLGTRWSANGIPILHQNQYHTPRRMLASTAHESKLTKAQAVTDVMVNVVVLVCVLAYSKQEMLIKSPIAYY